MQQAGYREQWLAYLEEGLVYSSNAGDALRTAALELEVGELQRHLGRLDAAQTCFDTARHTFAAAGDIVQTGAAKVCLANLAYLRERWLLALDLCGEVLAAILDLHFVRPRSVCGRRRIRSPARRSTGGSTLCGVAGCLGRAGGTALGCLVPAEPGMAGKPAWRKRPGFALCAQALATFVDLGALHSQAVVRQDWGIIEYLDGNMQAALLRYQEAEKIFRRLGDILYLAMVCNNIGLVYRAERKWEEAEAYYAESVGIYRELGTVLARINIDSGRGKLWLERGEAAKALAHFDRLLVSLQTTEKSAEHRRLYTEITEYHRQAAAALG